MKFVNLFLSALSLISATYSGNVKWAGFRYSTSGVQKSFGYTPDAANISEYVQALKQNLDEDAKGTLLLTVGRESNKKYCSFEFPNSNSTNLKNVKFSNKDKFEDILSKCDENDINVWLVVEPGSNDLVDLANIVLDQYGNHESVKGFGVDLEWWNREKSNNGQALTDEDAESVVKAIRERNENYTFLAKHWKISFMPKEYTNGMIYVDTAQSFRNRNQMTNELSTWADTFPENPVMFEVGYQSDKELWNNKPVEFANVIADAASDFNDNVGIIWTDFTLKEALEMIKYFGYKNKY
ncbi:hypothetical protein PIROE2DRAFT_11745 [Piromyces sp. E2]|nr:hypothetical protein PIROE2DRAFT_11745 [Piromyces sp. E2]|eukprot:OUM62095.1 hypothetical protein PIROE2DRAFT_11745 [Piromyces sp. E2]